MYRDVFFLFIKVLPVEGNCHEVQNGRCADENIDTYPEVTECNA